MPHKRKAQRKRGGPQIVKVQLSLFKDRNTPRQVLVYNESQSVLHEDEAPEELVKLMGRDLKAFFYYRLIKDPDHPGGKKIMLDRRAPWQDW